MNFNLLPLLFSGREGLIDSHKRQLIQRAKNGVIPLSISKLFSSESFLYCMACFNQYFSGTRGEMGKQKSNSNTLSKELRNPLQLQLGEFFIRKIGSLDFMMLKFTSNFSFLFFGIT